jgi:hypothetical protein
VEISELLEVDASQLIKIVILAIIVAVIALVARRGQSHSTGAPPEKPDHATGDEADRAGDEHSAAPEKETPTKRPQ